MKLTHAMILAASLVATGPLLRSDDHMFSSASDVGMTFHCSFDEKVEADSALGEKRSKLWAPAREDRILAPGMKNKALRIGVGTDQKEFLGTAFKPEKNISTAQGTVSFWIKPEDWQGTDGKFEIFFWAQNVPEKLNMYVYKYNTPNLFFLMRNGETQTIAKENIGKWQKGEWHFVCCSWTEKEMRLYVDGKLSNVEKRNFSSGKEFAEMGVGTRAWEVEGGFSLMDNLKIYNRVLTGEEIMTAYVRDGGSSRQNNSVILTVGGRSANPDGKMADGEYAFNASGFLDTDGTYALTQSYYSLSWDKDFLYIGVDSPQPGNAKAEVKDKDGNVWLDDSIEVWLANTEENSRYQIILNPLGTVYDAKITEKSDPSWDSGLKYAGAMNNGRWTAEVALPMRGLQMEQSKGKWKINIGRTFNSGNKMFSCIAPVRRALGYSDSENFALLSLDPDAPETRMSSPGDLNKGELKLQISVASQAPCSALFEYNTVERNWIKEDIKSVRTASGESIKCEKKNLIPGGKLDLKLTQGGKTLYQASFLTKNLSPVTVQYIYTDIEKQMLFTVVKNESGVTDGEIMLHLKERDSGKIASENKTKVLKDQMMWEIPWDISGLSPGDYNFEAEVASPDGSKGEKFEQFYRKSGEKCPWDDNKIGVSAEVPTPWIPIEADSEKVKCLKQTYTFRQNLFPESFEAAGHEILAAPMQLVINGYPVKDTKASLLSKNKIEARYRAEGTADNIKVTCNHTIEYDGMLETSLTIEPADGKSAPVKEVSLEIPLLANFAEQVHSCNGDTHRAKFGATGLTPISGWNKNLFNKPAFWVGNDDAGLSWFAETLRGWRVADKNKSVQIIPAGKTSLLRLNLINKPMELKGKREISFYMQGTPVKNASTEFRANRVNREWGWSEFSKYFNYLDPADEFLDSKGLSWHRKHYASLGANRFFHYIASNGASPYCPEWGYWGRIWTSRPLGDYILEQSGRGIEFRNKKVWTYSCLNSKSFREFFLWQLANCLDNSKVGLENLYYDLVGPRMCNNQAHGCGWTDDDGNIHPTLNITGSRDFHKRMYTLMKKRVPSALHLYHVTGAPCVSGVDAFGDALVEGETFFGNEITEKETYFGVINPELFRVAYYGQKWGQGTIFIPQLSRAASFHKPEKLPLWQNNPTHEMIMAQRHFLGYAYAHDVAVWTDNKPTQQEQDKTFKPAAKFLGGWEKAEFLPYWHPEKQPLSLKCEDAKRVIASVYANGGKIVVVVLNDTDSVQPVELKMKQPGEFTAKDADSQASLDVTSGGFKDTISRRDFKIYLIEKK